MEGKRDLQERCLSLFPRLLDEKVATLHLPAVGASLTVSAQEQTVCPGVKVEGLKKGGDYRF